MIKKIEDVIAAPAELTDKLNELIEVVNITSSRSLPPHMTMPTSKQHVAYIETMLQRLESGPCKSLSQVEPASTMVVAIGEAFRKLQEAVQAYKESLGNGNEF